MGFFDFIRSGMERIRSGMRSIGERLGVIERKAPEIRPEIKEIRKEIASIKETVSEIQKDIQPTERTIQERFPAEPTFQHRYRVTIQYRPVISTRPYRTETKYVDADSAEDAIEIAEESISEEPDYYLSILSERVE